MDRIECYVAGKKIASGISIRGSHIISRGDDFETPQDMFQICLNHICPVEDRQLYILRLFLHGVSNPPRHSVK